MKRRWVFAVVVSTLFHVVLIVGFRILLARAVRADQLATPAVATPAPAPPKQVEFIRVGLQSRAIAPTPAAAVPRSTAPAKSITVVAEGATGTEQVVDQPAPATQRTEPPSIAGPETPSAPPAAVGPSAELMALVHQRLSNGAARCYPPAAQRFRQTGTVNVAFCATRSGEIDHITVEGSSGSTLLDTAASDCVVPSANPLPSEAAGACFRLPVRFGQP